MFPISIIFLSPSSLPYWFYLASKHDHIFLAPLLDIHPEKTITQKDTCTQNVYHSTIYNSQDMEATYMFIDREMYKKDVVQIYNGILFSH